MADFNNDGKPDLALADNNDYVSILVGNGDGSFKAPVNSTVSGQHIAVVVGDFNGDGKPDLATTDGETLGDIDNVAVLLGNGDGTFHSALRSTAGSLSIAAAVGDFNRDGKADLAVSNYRSGDVSVLIGKGDGTFRAATNYNVGLNPNRIVVGDFNGDDKQDLAVANASSADVSVLLGNGDGTFRLAVSYGAGSGPSSVAVGDFNIDGNLDLAVANEGSGDVSVLLGNGDGTFQPASNYGTGVGAASRIAVGDLNRDGKADLAVTTGTGVSLLLGNGDGTFQSAVNYSIGTSINSSLNSILIDDFNGDGEPDLVMSSYLVSLSVLLNTCHSAGPALAIVAGKSNLTISWPLSSSGFILESTASLSMTNWQSAAVTQLTNNGRSEVTVPANSIELYFRLRKP